MMKDRNGKKPTVLVIDDDDLYRQTLQDILSDGGYRALGAENGHDGIDVVAKGIVDVVICDILMPEKEGIETIIDLRKSRPELKIIAISGGITGGDVLLRAAGKLGADACLPKPIHSKDLLGLVAGLIEGREK